MVSRHVSLLFIVCFIIIHKAELQKLQLSYCQAIADPHIYPFGITTEEWCTQNGSQVLLQNSFLQLSIHVASPPGTFYPIDDFTFDFHPTGVSPWCVFDSSDLQSLGTGACSTPGVTITVTGSGWIIQYLTTLVVTITEWGGGGMPTYYNIQIAQATSELPYSSGLCVCGCPSAYIYNQGQGPANGKRKRQASPCAAAYQQWQQQGKTATQQAITNFNNICAEDIQGSGTDNYVASAYQTLDMDVIQQQNPNIQTVYQLFLQDSQNRS